MGEVKDLKIEKEIPLEGAVMVEVLKELKEIKIGIAELMVSINAVRNAIEHF